jgi:hypothetical protein
MIGNICHIVFNITNCVFIVPMSFLEAFSKLNTVLINVSKSLYSRISITKKLVIIIGARIKNIEYAFI